LADLPAAKKENQSRHEAQDHCLNQEKIGGMSDPNLVLQTAISEALKNNPALSVLVGARIYDYPPGKPEYPYITLGEGHTLGDDTEDCGDASEVFVQIHGWSRNPASGFAEVKRVAAAIRDAMKVPVSLSEFVVTVTEYVQTQFLREPDGVTRHAMVEFRYLIDHTS
jgi:hypothetical protein